jgi:hypothetical protein
MFDLGSADPYVSLTAIILCTKTHVLQLRKHCTIGFEVFMVVSAKMAIVFRL